jgi:hypothetical protein
VKGWRIVALDGPTSESPIEAIEEFNVIEQYGGLWLDRSASAPAVVKEEYDSTLRVSRIWLATWMWQRKHQAQRLVSGRRVEVRSLSRRCRAREGRPNGPAIEEQPFWVKGKALSDPPWSLPLWGSIAGQGIYGCIEDAVAHLNAIEAQYIERRAGRGK